LELSILLPLTTYRYAHANRPTSFCSYRIPSDHHLAQYSSGRHRAAGWVGYLAVNVLVYSLRHKTLLHNE
jgi:hypothetical protein